MSALENIKEGDWVDYVESEARYITYGAIDYAKVISVNKKTVIIDVSTTLEYRQKTLSKSKIKMVNGFSI